MWFLRLLIYVVSNILLSIKPNKRYRRVKSKTVKSDRRLSAKVPGKVGFPTTESIEADRALLDKTVSSVVADVEERNPEPSDGVLVTEAEGGISEEIVFDVPDNLTEVTAQDNILSFTLHEDADLLLQSEVAIPTSASENLPKEIELENNISAQSETDITVEDKNSVSEAHQVLLDSIEPVVDTKISPVLDVPESVEIEPALPPGPETETIQEPYSTPTFEKDVIDGHPEDQVIEGENTIEDAFDEDEFDEDENTDEDEENDEETIPDFWEGGIETTVESIGKYSDEEVLRIEKGRRTQTSKKSTRSTYYFNLIVQRSLAPKLSEQEINAFLIDLQADNLEAILTWSTPKLENYLFHALQHSEFIGELPISSDAFTQFVEYIRRAARNNRKTDLKRIPPALFLVSMVFCARYSESEARNFWEPYASMVWGLDKASLSFQQKCRKHFVNCREDFHQVLSISFNYQNAGDVVRPVYQHAIIPSYLQGPFADWLVNNFEALLQYSAKQLPLILHNEKSLDYMPRRLRDFIRGEETKETAARLITRMSNAVKLFHESEQSEAVESVMSSSIERSLWEVIYKKLINDQSQLVKLRRITPRLEWYWDLEDEEIILNLSNIRSDRGDKPDSVTWAEKDAKYLKGNEILVKVFPWKMRSGDWEVDPVRIPADGPLDGSILVLSEDFDLDKDKQSQDSHVIFERSVPPLKKPVLFFRVNPRRNVAVRKDQIDSDGAWIIASCEHIQVTDSTGNQVQVRPQNMPYRLRESGLSQAGMYSIQLPVTILLGEEAIVVEGIEDQQEINPFLRGTEKVSGLSTDIPPVFLSPNVDFLFSINPDSHPLRRTWLSIRRNGEFMQSILLADLLNQGKMRIYESHYIVDLTSFLTQSGAYSINLLHNMRSLLDEPVQFAWLPDDVEIIGPSPDVCYSPINPLLVTIRGVSQEQVIPIHDEKSKITSEGNAVKIEWKVIRNPQCRFDIFWENSLIHFCWNIDRVSAWIEGGGDKNQVSEDQELDVVLHARGQSKEAFSWIIEGIGKQRNTQLNARGEFHANLLETEVRDMLLEDNQAKSTVSIAIRGYTWRLFEYYKKPVIEITKVCFKKPVLEVSLTQVRKLQGTYIFQIRNTTDQSKPEILSAVEVLKDNLIFQVILNPGEYRIEVLLYDTLIHSSPTFKVEEEPAPIEEVSTKVQVVADYGSPEHLFRVLTANRQDLLSRSYDGLPVTPAIEQLQLIHTPEEWLTNERWNDGFKRLLPSWAVLMYPLRFTTKNHRRILHVFPEKVAYGGRAGRGYIELKLAEDKMRITASWRPGKDPEYSELWMGISQEKNIRFFSELDQDDLWPAYQCKDCGTIVASRNGTYLKLPPSVVRLHQHGEDRNLNEQFIDTVYDKQNKVEVSIAQYKEKPLLHAYWAKEVVFNNYLKFLIEGKTRPVRRDLEQPLNLYSNNDYGLAVSDLFEHLQHPAIQKFLEFSSELDRLDQYIEDEKFNVPAFNAMQRLMQYMYESTSPLNLPGDVLSLAMALRLKANQPRAYGNLLANLGISEDSLVKVVECTALGCPKMLEWSIAWAELFYVHTIS